MLSGAPGGVGPFELVLFSLLPSVPTPDLIAGIVVFRALYYAGPALIGVLIERGHFDLDSPAPVPAWQSPGDPRREIMIADLMRMIPVEFE